MSECRYYTHISGGWFSSDDYFCALREELDNEKRLSYDEKKANCCDTYESDREERCPYLARQRSMNTCCCFITSACVKSKGLPDDCEELEVLRTFRDDYMRSFCEGRAATEEYYRIAPSIVAAIDALDNAAAVWEEIYTGLILKAISLIRQNKLYEAYDLYRKYVLMLREKYIGGGE